MPFVLYIKKGSNAFSNCQTVKQYLILKTKLGGEFSKVNRWLTEALTCTDFTSFQQTHLQISFPINIPEVCARHCARCQGYNKGETDTDLVFIELRV